MLWESRRRKPTREGFLENIYTVPFCVKNPRLLSRPNIFFRKPFLIISQCTCHFLNMSFPTPCNSLSGGWAVEMKESKMVKSWSLGDFKKLWSQNKEKSRGGTKSFFDELINLLDILELECQQDIKWLYPEAGEIMEGVA